MAYDFRTASAEDWDDIAHVLSDAFNNEFNGAEAELQRPLFEPDRTVLATQDGVISGTGSIFTRDLTVPGAIIPAAHVTMVGVSVTHRRRGLLTQMIGLLHDQAVRLGESVAVLWASEGRIYQRFGYGLAAWRLIVDARTEEVEFLDATPTTTVWPVRAVPASSAHIFRPVFESARSQRPGWSSRDDRWWRYVLNDTPSLRQGLGQLRAVVHDGPSGVDGYLLWRARNEWDDSGPNGTVHIKEMVATNSAAYRALWQFAISVDLTRHVRMSFATTAEPLHYMVVEPRRLQTRISDALWVRLLDVPTALAARRYAAPVDVVIEVSDNNIAANTGRWRLVGSPESSTCTPTDAPADLACTASTLGGVYLGSTPLTSLQAAGRVREVRPGALAAASTAFYWHVPPGAIEEF